MPFRACTVSFVHHGQRFEAKVDAESAYEAAVLALKAFSHRHYVKGPAKSDVLEIRVETPMTVRLKAGDVIKWLYDKPGRTREQKARKEQLRMLLADDRR